MIGMFDAFDIFVEVLISCVQTVVTVAPDIWQFGHLSCSRYLGITGNPQDSMCFLEYPLNMALHEYG